MKLIIELPDVFKEHFDFDKFQDSFMRICGDIRTKGSLSGFYEYELADELKNAFSKADEFKGEAQRTSRDNALYLWLSRACRAKLEIRYWQSINRNFFGYRFNVRHEITDEGRYATEWIRLWTRIESLCLEKAKEFE